jgi:hypothetical protein
LDSLAGGVVWHADSAMAIAHATAVREWILFDMLLFASILFGR